MIEWLAPAAIGLGSAFLGSRASKDAANTQSQALDRSAEATLQAQREALAFQREGRDLARADLAPYRDAGLQDYGALRANIGTQFQESPGYRFALQEGINAIDRGASARGLLNSGARLRELTRYGQGMANQEYGNWLSRLQGLAGVGQTATGQGASLAQQAGQTAANTAMQTGGALAGIAAQQGQAQAAGGVNATNALLGGANAGLGLYALMNPSWGTVRS